MEIVRRTKGDGFKIVFRPGKGFFRDYEYFYLRKSTRILQFERAADEVQVQKPLAITRYFFEQRLGGANLGDLRFTEGDIQFARELIERFGYDECRPFIDYALAAAKGTKFEMKTLRGTQQYLVTWEANKEQREKARAKEQERATESRNKALKDTYTPWRAATPSATSNPFHRTRAQLSARKPKNASCKRRATGSASIYSLLSKNGASR